MTIKALDRVEIFRACAWALNSDGSPQAVDTIYTAPLYKGLEFDMVTDFAATVPNPRILPVVAQGEVDDVFLLPSITARSAVMHTPYQYLDNDAVLGNVKRYTVGDLDISALDTDQEASGPVVALLVSALVGHDKDTKQPVWDNQLYPRATIMPLAINAKFDGAVAQYTYYITWGKTTVEFWGTTLSLATMGTLKAGARGVRSTGGRVNFGIWKTDGVTKDFLFDTNKPCVDGATAVAYDYATGAPITPAP